MSWNSDQKVVLAHVILAKTPGNRKSTEIRKWVPRQLTLWVARRHEELEGNTKDRGFSQEKMVGQDEYNKKGLAQRLHSTVGRS